MVRDHKIVFSCIMLAISGKYEKESLKVVRKIESNLEYEKIQ